MRTNIGDSFLGTLNEKQLQLGDIIAQNMKASTQGISPMEQLKLLYDKNDQPDIDQLRDILSNKLQYPSSRIARTHIRANKLGTLDLKTNQSQSYASSKIQRKIQLQKIQNYKYCPCCGFIQQTQNLSLCTNIHKIKHIGVSTYLYFFTLKEIIVILLLMFFIFSIFSIKTNVQTAKNMSANQNTNATNSYLSQMWIQKQIALISLGMKMSQKNQIIQCCLGILLILLWGILFIISNLIEIKNIKDIDFETKTVGDYTLVFQNMPKNMTKIQLERQLKQYQRQIQKTDDSYLASRQIKIAKINQAMPFYLDQSSFNDKQLKKINKQYQKYQKQLRNWIQHRQKYSTFSMNKKERTNIYQKFDEAISKKQQKMAELTEQVLNQKIKQQNFIETVPTFITFKSSYNKIFIENMHETQNYRFLFYLPFFKQKKYFHFDLKDGSKPKFAYISKAPQPQDIIWTNLGQEKYIQYLKKVLTFSIAFLLLIPSFLLFYKLSVEQHQLELNQNWKDTFYYKFLSIIVPLVSTIFNILLQKFIVFLTIFQRNDSQTKYQTSLGLKAIFLLILNSIVIPLVVHQLLIKNIYGTNDFAQDVFYLAITNSYMTPILKIFDFPYFFSKLQKWYYNRPNSKLYLSQEQLNAKLQYKQFQIGQEYIYIFNLYFFTCFYVTIQPIIPVFTVTGIILMYWVQKYVLFNRCKKPPMSTDIINDVMFKLILVGPLFFSFGLIYLKDFIVQNPINDTFHLALIILSIIIIFCPFKYIANKILIWKQSEKKQIQQLYQQNRMYFPSQYNRLNPLTSKQGIQDYMQYISRQIAQKQKIFTQQNSFKEGFNRNDMINPALKSIIDGNNIIKNKKTNNIRVTNTNISNIGQNQIIKNTSNPFIKFLQKIKFMPNTFGSNIRKTNIGGQLQNLSVIQQNWLTKQQLSKKQVTNTNAYKNKTKNKNDFLENELINSNQNNKTNQTDRLKKRKTLL